MARYKMECPLEELMGTPAGDRDSYNENLVPRLQNSHILLFITRIIVEPGLPVATICVTFLFHDCSANKNVES